MWFVATEHRQKFEKQIIDEINQTSFIGHDSFRSDHHENRLLKRFKTINDLKFKF